MRKVIIKEPTLNTILVSCLRYYKREVGGLLTGYRKNDFWFADNAFLSTIDGFCSIDYEKSKRNLRKLREIVEDMNLSVVGDFHSHTDYADETYVAEPSEDDLKDMLKNPGWIFLILEMHKQRRKQTWKRAIHGGFYGSMGDNYFCSMRAFCVNIERKRKYDDVKIICPEISSFNFS